MFTICVNGKLHNTDKTNFAKSLVFVRAESTRYLGREYGVDFVSETYIIDSAVVTFSARHTAHF